MSVTCKILWRMQILLPKKYANRIANIMLNVAQRTEGLETAKRDKLVLLRNFPNATFSTLDIQDNNFHSTSLTITATSRVDETIMILQNFFQKINMM